MISDLIKSIACSQGTCEDMLSNSDQLHSFKSRYSPPKMDNEQKMGKLKKHHFAKIWEKGEEAENLIVVLKTVCQWLQMKTIAEKLFFGVVPP